MYNSILFSTLHLHAGHEADAHTLSKTLAVYQNEIFEFIHDDFYENSGELKYTIKALSAEAQGKDSELFRHFTWHLN